MTTGGTKYWHSGEIPMIGPDILGGILTSVSDVGLVISDDGTVLSVLLNPAFTDRALFEGIDGRQVTELLSPDSRAKFEARLKAYLEDGSDRAIEVNHATPDSRRGLPIRYSFHRIGRAGAVLMLGQDLRPVAEMQQQLVSAQLALEKDYEAQRDFETRFRVVLDTAPEGILMVSAQSGMVTDANPRAERLLGLRRTELLKSRFDALFQSAGAEGALLDRLRTLALSDVGGEVEVALTGGARVRVTPTMFRSAGERVLLCRIVPRVAESVPPDRMGQMLRGLHDRGPDGIVFTDERGRILSVNEGFLNLIGVAHDTTVRDTALADLLQRGMVDVSVMTQNAQRAGRLRSYATRLRDSNGTEREVDIAVTGFQAGEDRLFAFVVRDGRQSEPPRDGEGTPGLDSVVELVGSSTLREIVSETTGVVERMCIETAIKLTMNNRVAAAEMLGLSRQSLYVKLRKFGMIEQTGD